MSLYNIPIEIINLIASLLDKTALQQTRLVNKTWNVAASKYLFNTVSMIPTEEGIDVWNAILGDSKIRKLPRKVIINSSPVPGYEFNVFSLGRDEIELLNNWGPDPEEEEYANFYAALNDFVQFPNLEHPMLQFSNICAGEADNYNTGIESVEYRLDILQRVFTSLDTRRKNLKRNPIRSLTVCNLQNFPLPDFTTSAIFKDTLASVEELHLQVCEEVNEHGPDNDIYCEEKRTFMPYLKDHWLMPIATHLTSLTLYVNDTWGPFPGYFDGSGLSFPALQTLTLGEYCLGHQDAFDWVLRQSSLRSLRLHGCTIVSYLRIESGLVSEWNVPKHDWAKVPGERFGLDDSDYEVYHYAGTWAEVFASIRSSLNGLEDFKFHFDKQRTHVSEELACFGRPDLLEVELSPQRYTAFNMALLPSHWGNMESSGELTIGDDGECVNVYEENEQKDREALDMLLNELTDRQLQYYLKA